MILKKEIKNIYSLLDKLRNTQTQWAAIGKQMYIIFVNLFILLHTFQDVPYVHLHIYYIDP